MRVRRVGDNAPYHVGWSWLVSNNGRAVCPQTAAMRGVVGGGCAYSMCGLFRRNGARLREMAALRVLPPAQCTRVHFRGGVLRKSAHFRSLRSAGGGETSRAWHLRVFGASHRRACAGSLVSFPLAAPQLPAHSSAQSGARRRCRPMAVCLVSLALRGACAEPLLRVSLNSSRVPAPAPHGV